MGGGNLRNKPLKGNGFTLIELLAVIVILAIIALIVVPQVIKILNKARLSSAEDSTYGIVKSAENYITEFMLKNNGELPNMSLTFSCGNDGCSLNEIDKLSSYNLTDLDKLNYKGTKATSGLVTIKENGNIEVNNVIINGFTCNYPIDEKAKCYTSDDLKDLLEINNISLTPSLNSIKVVLNISGNASKYEYSIDNVNYFESTDNTYTFDNLEASHEYTIYVRVSNDSKTKEASKVVKTLELSAPEITVDKKDTWTQSKKVTIKYPSGENLVYSYKIKSLDGNTILVDNTTVTEETTNVEVTENSLVVATVTLGSSSQPASEEVTNIDRTIPESSTFTETHTTNSITLTSSGIDSESGIYGYQFSIDNGTTWLPNEPQKTNAYTFNNVGLGSYNLKVRIINNTYSENGINELNTKTSETVVLNAYTLSYDLNGGTGTITNQVSLENTDLTITNVEPTRENFSFLGWSTNSSATEAEYEKGSTINLTGNVILYAVWKSNKSSSGEAMELGGYKWHVLGDDGENLTLLMDAGQIEDMAHCTNDTDESTDCGVSNGYYQYSWDKSLINKYLKETLYPELKNKISNEIVPVDVCIDPSRGDGVVTYGGYLKSEIDNIDGASCSNGYETDYVRLITYSEYWNISPYYSGTDTSYPNVSTITRLSKSSDYAEWLYCSNKKCGCTSYSGFWWTMISHYYSHAGAVPSARYVSSDGSLNSHNGGNVFGVRPVITIKK